jgi:hypothetical protein
VKIFYVFENARFVLANYTVTRRNAEFHSTARMYLD